MLHFKSELLAFSARNAFPQLFAWIFLTHPFAASVKTFPLIAVPSSNRSSLIVFVVCFHNFPFYMNLYTILHLIFEILDVACFSIWELLLFPECVILYAILCLSLSLSLVIVVSLFSF